MLAAYCTVTRHCVLPTDGTTAPGDSLPSACCCSRRRCGGPWRRTPPTPPRPPGVVRRAEAAPRAATPVALLPLTTAVASATSMGAPHERPLGRHVKAGKAPLGCTRASTPADVVNKQLPNTAANPSPDNIRRYRSPPPAVRLYGGSDAGAALKVGKETAGCSPLGATTRSGCGRRGCCVAVRESCLAMRLLKPPAVGSVSVSQPTREAAAKSPHAEHSAKRSSANFARCCMTAPQHVRAGGHDAAAPAVESRRVLEAGDKPQPSRANSLAPPSADTTEVQRSPHQEQLRCVCDPLRRGCVKGAPTSDPGVGPVARL